MPPDKLAWLLIPILLFDAPRYALSLAVLCLVDMIVDGTRWLFGKEENRAYSSCPPITVIIAGLNEGSTIRHTLASLWGKYPRMEIVVVDDGSSDDMAKVAQEFARHHSNVLVLKKPCRGGKSSALNFALPFVKSEVIVCVDGDSHIDDSALWEIVQPFADPKVGAVSGTVVARNPFSGLITWLQAFEYLRCIFVGRRLSARLNILGVISGAFGAYRKSALDRTMGWDVGPGEDSDITLRLRKAGYRIAFQPYAQCFTNLPTSWIRLVKQRRRWEWAAITFECRKHIDLGNFFSPNFHWSNLGVLLDRWIFNVASVYVLWGYFFWVMWNVHENTWNQFFLYYIVYVAFDLVMLGVIQYYSVDRRRDFRVGLCIPFNPFYGLFMKGVALVALTEEVFTRRSFRDTFVPEHVRRATWHW
jgi:biofilm PGA synthesis N-glycosyltransferase PgaC